MSETPMISSKSTVALAGGTKGLRKRGEAGMAPREGLEGVVGAD